MRIYGGPFYFLVLRGIGPSSGHKTLMQCYIMLHYRQFQSFGISFNIWEQVLEQLVITESLQNKKKFEESSKKEGGGDVKHVYFFTRPYRKLNTTPWWWTSATNIFLWNMDCKYTHKRTYNSAGIFLLSNSMFNTT